MYIRIDGVPSLFTQNFGQNTKRATIFTFHFQEKGSIKIFTSGSHLKQTVSLFHVTQKLNFIKKLSLILLWEIYKGTKLIKLFTVES